MQSTGVGVLNDCKPKLTNAFFFVQTVIVSSTTLQKSERHGKSSTPSASHFSCARNIPWSRMFRVFGKAQQKELSEIRKTVECIHNDVMRILKHIALRKIDFEQTGGGMNYSIQAGTKGTFKAVLTPTNGAMAAGTVPQWSASDPAITLVPSTDGLTCDANVPATFTGNFDLSLSATSSDPTAGVNGKIGPQIHLIQVTAAPPPPPAPLTGIDFVQTA